ncbi:MAG: YggT family protein [Gammaproteobacteria bacterium]|nr:YggT family protein [Gammaproteobacteria bacterium]MBT8150010.1 YggT family protein [Gammaproteobacteria bacterium]NND40134.1 YggT family protein [Pseudomonadales bacterium]NNL10418.1 YggT family protein [Pseudomonadales bacterium]RZV58554.1 MAG: YggT family protein [Pseudomonadales bacterium]
MLQQILHLLVTVAVDIFTLLVLLRLMLQGAKADFYNPISQFIVRATDPLLKPIRRMIPGLWGIDMASVALALLVQCAGILLLTLLSGQVLTNPFAYLLIAIFNTAEILLQFYFFAIIILVVISWVAPTTYNPAAVLLQQVTDPIIRPVRSALPDMGGLDFSPMVVLFVIYILRSIVMPGLLATLGGFL